MVARIPETGTQSSLSPSISSFLEDKPRVHLGDEGGFLSERRHNLELFGFQKLARHLQAPMGKLDSTSVRGPHGSVRIRLFYPKSVAVSSNNEKVASLV